MANETRFGQRIRLFCCPCLYFCKPKLASIDCCLCHHESKRKEQLTIPPLIEMSSTWINFNDQSPPIPIWFIILRYLLTFGMITITISNFSFFVTEGIVRLWPIYLTQWTLLLSTISMIIKSISTYTVNAMYNLSSSNTNLYTLQLDGNTKIWTLHIIHDILLQITIPGSTLVVFQLSKQ